VDVVEQTRRWWDSVPMNVEAARPGREASAVQAANTLYVAERHRAGQVLNEHTGPLYSMFAQRAAAAVERVSAVLPLPPRVWSALEPVNVLAADTRETLQEAERVMNTCHFMALYLRSMGVPGTDSQLLGDDPVEGLTFRRWAEFNAHRHELGPIRQPLKLAYAVEHGWEPGVWLAEQLRGIDQGPARRRFMPAFLVR
jgi:hypothetical protein